ncbi:MAG: hypothetical protein WC310_04780 [Patescibacteria group bacterium]|jgi:hypothetical protein
MIPRFSQLFIYSPDKSSSLCKIFITTPSLDKEQSLGRLFGIIEIESNDRGLWDTIENLATLLEKSYYGEDNILIDVGRPTKEISVEETFEKTIQTFNDKLIELIKGGKLAKLLEKMNITVGVLKNKKLYFAAVGNTSAFLLHQLKSQEYRMIDVLDSTGGREEKINPFKILSNVVNGEIDKNDSMIFCTNTLLDYLSLDKIKQTLTTLDPAAASRHLKDLLLEASINTVFASIILKLIPDEEEIKSQKEIRLPQRSLNTLISTEKTTEQYLSPPFKFNLIKYSTIILRSAKNTMAAAFSYSVQKAKSAQEKRQQKSKETQIIDVNNEIEITDTTPIAVDEESSIDAKFIMPIQEYAIPTTETVETPLSAQIKSKGQPKSIITPQNQTSVKIATNLWMVIKKAAVYVIHTTKKTAIWLGRTGKSLYYIITNKDQQRRKERQKLYSLFISWLASYVRRFRALPPLSRKLLIFSAVLFVLFVFSIAQTSYNKTAAKQRAVFDNSVSQIEALNDKIQGALIYNDETQAQDLYKQVQDIYSQLKINGKDEVKTAGEIKQKMDEVSARLQHVAKIKAQKIATLEIPESPANIAAMNIVGTKIFLLNSNNNSLYYLDTAGSEIKPLNLSSNDPQIKFGLLYNNDIIYYHGGNGLIRFTTKESKLENVNINLNGQENKVTDIESYNNRLYVISAANNQIYRYTGNPEGFGEPSNWVKDSNRDLNTAVSMTVDGDVYILQKDGNIQKFTSGRKQNFSLSMIEPKLNEPQKIWTDSKSDNLYILDKSGRIVVADKSNGKITTQYVVEELTGLTNFIVAEKDKKIYLLTDTSSIYLLNL